MMMMGRQATMRKLSALLASASLTTSCAFLHTYSIPPLSSRWVGASTGSVFRPRVCSPLPLLVGGRNAKCSALMDQSRDGSSSAGRVTLEKIVDSLKEGNYKKILVVAGAGVSCSAGIPDVSFTVEHNMC